MAGGDVEEARFLSPAYRRRFLFIMFWVCLFDFADRAVFNVTQESIKAEFALTDFELGVLGATFAVLFAVAGLPIGRLADRFSRTRIIAACTALWSLSTMLCGLAGNYVTMALGRVGVGLGEAGFMGPVNSLVADQFPAGRRASRMSLILLGSPCGVLLGANLGGWAAETWDWRAAFLLLGAPGVLVAILILLFLREPPRGLVDGLPRSSAPAAGQRGIGAFVREIGRSRTLLWIMGGGVLAGFGMTSVSMFLAPFLARSHDLSPGEAGALFGAVSAVSMSIGFLGGSFGTDWLSRRDGRWPAWGAALGLTVAPLAYWAGLTVPGTAPAAALLVVAGIFHVSFYGPTLGMIQSIIRPDMRATGVALYAMLNVLGGYFCGPPVVGFLSDRFAQAAFPGGDFPAACPGGAAPPGAGPALDQACAAALASGLQQAMMCAVAVFLAAAFCYLMASRTLRRDTAARAV